MQLRFTKMHSVGNDFMIVCWPAGVELPDAALVRRWADRRRGVGFDQLLLIQQSQDEADADAAYRVFNGDGSEVEQCGNGVRCVARLLAGRNQRQALKLISPAGIVEAQVSVGGAVSVNLGEPDFDPGALPFQAAEERDCYPFPTASGTVELGAVSMGNPHAVIRVDSVEAAPVGILGAELQGHAAFPRGVNVGFMEVQDSKRIRLRVFERGAGETLACGTGAGAAVAVGRRWGVVAERVQVSLPGGTLEVEWPGPGTPLRLTGQTTTVYEGQVEL